MARGNFPSAKQDQFVLRLPDGMRDRIKSVAEANNRSMNAEIVATLEDRYPAPDGTYEKILSLLSRAMDMRHNAKSAQDVRIAEAVLARVEAEFAKLHPTDKD